MSDTTTTRTVYSDPFAALLERIPEEIAKKLCEALSRLIPEYATEADLINLADKGNKPYHKGPHSGEMAFDAESIRTPAANFFKQKDGIALELFVKLIQGMHAAHDIVQGQNAIDKEKNERLSAENFSSKFTEILNQSNCPNPLAKDLKEKVDEYTHYIIVKGTCFDFNTKQQPIMREGLSDNVLRDSPLLALSSLVIAVNDTTRMIRIPTMLKDPAYLKIFKRQYEALKATNLVKTFSRTWPKAITLNGSELYRRKKNSLKATQPSDLAKSFEGRTEAELMNLFSFMHIFGQNLKVNSEFGKAGDVGADLFKSYMMDGTLPTLTPQNVDAAYEFIMGKQGIMFKSKGELTSDGFSQGMTWTKTGIPALNQLFREKYHVHFDIFPELYTDLWPDYIKNATVTLKDIQSQLDKSTNKAEFKKNFVQDCLLMARNQAGLFIMDDAKPSNVNKPLSHRLA